MKKGILFLVTSVMTVIFLGNTTASAQTHWTGDGGRGRSITVMVPQATRLPDSLNYLPVLVQGELVDNFSRFSAISVFDRQAWEKQQAELMSESYDASAEAMINIGRQAPTQYFLTGNITQTASGYALQLSVVETAGNNTVVATHSGTSTFAELDNLTGVRRASLDLLQQIGVTLTAQARTTLGGAATATHVSAQTAMSRGIVAQRQGTEVAAHSFFYLAAALDPSLTEAVARSRITSANITGANIGDNIRNDIVWRRNWVARLTQTEEAFHQMLSSAAPPYTLHYSTGIETRDINYQTETANLSIPINLTANQEWFAAMNRALQAANEVLNGLNATNRKNDWQLGGWPRNGVTNNNPFGHRMWQHDMAINFELVDQQGRVIGRQTARLNPSFSINVNHNNQFVIHFTENTSETVTFRNVRADDISDQLTIRVATINNQSPEQARLAIRALSAAQRAQGLFLRIENGVVMGFANNAQREQHRNLVIPAEAFGNPVTAIAPRAFENNGLTNVTIPNTVVSIGERAFANNRLPMIGTVIPESVKQFAPNSFAENDPDWVIQNGVVIRGPRSAHLYIPDEAWGRPVTAIGAGAFENKQTERVSLPQLGMVTRMTDGITYLVIPNTITYIGPKAFAGNNFQQIVIGANVTIAEDAFARYYFSSHAGSIQTYDSLWNRGRSGVGSGSDFRHYYTRFGRVAGTYTKVGTNWRGTAPEMELERATEDARNNRIEWIGGIIGWSAIIIGVILLIL